MENVIRIGVYRRLDNRSEGFADDSLRALELHKLRQEALHSALGSEPDLQVVDWGQTDDVRSHEYVELLVSAVGPALHYLAGPGLIWLGGKLAEKLTDATLSELAKRIVSRLWPKQEAKKIQDFSIQLPDGSWIRLDPPDMGGAITVSFKGGAVESVKYVSGAP